MGGERIDIVPWHPDPEIFARRALAPARVAKVISDAAKHVMTAIVDEDQLSLAIGRNGQNVRLASQLIGWQLDLYGSREWLERGADLSIFGDIPSEESYEMSDFPLAELELDEVTLATLETAGYHTFLDIIDLEKTDFLKVPGLTESGADRLLEIIDELTVVEGEADAEAPAEAEASVVEETQAEEPEAEGEAQDVTTGLDPDQESAPETEEESLVPEEGDEGEEPEV